MVKIMNSTRRMENVDFFAITACGECCDTCDKMKAGECPGCIQADGSVPEWADSGRCRIHACVREHGAKFCGLCEEFPCDRVSELIPWNPNIIEHLAQLRDQYNEISEKTDLNET